MVNIVMLGDKPKATFNGQHEVNVLLEYDRLGYGEMALFVAMANGWTPYNHAVDNSYESYSSRTANWSTKYRAAIAICMERGLDFGQGG